MDISEGTILFLSFFFMNTEGFFVSNVPDEAVIVAPFNQGPDFYFKVFHL